MPRGLQQHHGPMETAGMLLEALRILQEADTSLAGDYLLGPATTKTRAAAAYEPDGGANRHSLLGMAPEDIQGHNMRPFAGERAGVRARTGGSACERQELLAPGAPHSRGHVVAQCEASRGLLSEAGRGNIFGIERRAPGAHSGPPSCEISGWGQLRQWLGLPAPGSSPWGGCKKPTLPMSRALQRDSSEGGAPTIQRSRQKEEGA